MDLYSSKHAPARSLEAAMGDPLGEGLFSYARRAEEDECEQYPLEALQWLDRWGMQQHYVPVSLGGALSDFEVLFSLVRTISRRDLTVAISHAVSFLGSAGVWIAGSQEQKSGLACRLFAGERVSLALTERNHGGDLLSIETDAHLQKQDCRLLTGEKWLINGATRNSLIAVLARTNPKGGPRGFSLVLFDKLAATPGSFECLEKVRTLGVRGSDISGIRFQQAALGPSAIVGDPGEGFEVVLKGLQLTRLLCGAISLGAAETAFQVALDFALERRVYGRTVFEIPECRRLLVEAWVDLLLCDSLLTASARSLHFAPSEASVHSSVVKYLVPQLLEHTLKQLSVVLGARYYLRDEYHCGIFQRMMRDSSLISLFDGSSVVNLYSLTTQFKALSRCWEKSLSGSMSSPSLPVCELSVPLPEFAWSDLSLAGGGQNCFLESLPCSFEAVRSLGGHNCPPADVVSALQQQVGMLGTAANTLMKEIGSINFASPHVVTSQAFDKARDYCAVEAAAMTLQMWLANRGRENGYFADGQWLVQALTRLNACLGQKTNLNDAFIEILADQLTQSCGRMPYSPSESAAVLAA
jgi:alkylation response protein AidB-like acyl-CoA dehydrogenase